MNWLEKSKLQTSSPRKKNRAVFAHEFLLLHGFEQTGVEYERDARLSGETKYPVSKMVRFAIDGITSFSTVPLRIATWLGVGAGVVGIGTAVWAFIAGMRGEAVPGWTTIMILVSLGSCAQLLMMGILGEYVGRIYEEVKRRPLYVIAEETNLSRTPAERAEAAADRQRSV